MIVATVLIFVGTFGASLYDKLINEILPVPIRMAVGVLGMILLVAGFAGMIYVAGRIIGLPPIQPLP